MGEEGSTHTLGKQVSGERAVALRAPRRRPSAAGRRVSNEGWAALAASAGAACGGGWGGADHRNPAATRAVPDSSPLASAASPLPTPPPSLLLAAPRLLALPPLGRQAPGAVVAVLSREGVRELPAWRVGQQLRCCVLRCGGSCCFGAGGQSSPA